VAAGNQLSILDPTGDTKILWDPDDDTSVEVARAAFETAIKKGYVAYAVTGKGDKGKQLHKFDPEEGGLIIMRPVMAGG
jgi:hypothetical protein